MYKHIKQKGYKHGKNDNLKGTLNAQNAKGQTHEKATDREKGDKVIGYNF